MFQWSLTLSDKQVQMLVAFHNSEPDNNGSQFHAAHAMIGDAWDIRAVRKLEEMNLISVEHPKEKKIGSSTIWRITDKGTLIALAILEDSSALNQISNRKGLSAYYAINSTAHPKRLKKAA